MNHVTIYLHTKQTMIRVWSAKQLCKYNNKFYSVSLWL